MAQRSAGIVLYRQPRAGPEVLLVHPGGPFWRSRDAGAWQIPKGLIAEGENAATAAWRETEEELGVTLRGAPEPLVTIRQAGGKIVEVFCLEQDIDATAIRSNTFEMEWPPRSGRRVAFPEVDAARWLSLDDAEAAILKSQAPLLAALRERLARRPGGPVDRLGKSPKSPPSGAPGA